ncbi:LiaF transmembrane domain-containing protein [Egicoccus halophilus]|uniref:LiaF transmembrane domain-containing protein n=1 Tax=Egicoccus halophilus TaxID=1670830 RepID=A0A8J3ETB9_9ACTN|nr:hypothetical protein [Egicoccus halophilus]GGI03615.1 hypothetical protein GCM10011354_04920 [Egicoccus halophilus]
MNHHATTDPSTVPPSGRDAVRAAGDGLTALGLVLVASGLWAGLAALEVLPPGTGSWWPVLLLAAAGWLAGRGRRSAAGTMAVVGTVLLVVTNVPGEYLWPASLIALGVLVIAGAARGRRLLHDFPGVSGIALFDDREVEVADGAPLQPLVAVFGETSADLHGLPAGDEVVNCVAVFGSTTLTVPRDVDVEVRPLAVFGDVRTPVPTTGTPARGVVRVRGTAVFGDVRIRRA